jgi:hypothetical protein
MPTTVDVPTTKWSLLEWRRIEDEKPKENDRCLVIIGAVVLVGRFHSGQFYLDNWTRAKSISYWSPWPKAIIS